MTDDDYWLNFDQGTPSAPLAGPSIETIDGVAAFEPGQEPSEGALRLQSLLFPKNGPARSCYALIDAAWVFGLPERLEDADLLAKCLFKGDAADEFGDVAPWLIQLEEGADFTRDLLTASDAHWHNWADEPGIFILSDQPFEQIYAHLRKFTKLRDTDENWLFFRYWDPELLVLLAQSKLDHLLSLFVGHFDIVARVGDQAHVLRGAGMQKNPLPGDLSPPQRALIASTYTKRRCRGIAEAIREEFPDDVIHHDDDALTAEVRDALRTASAFGLRDGRVRAKFTIMAVATVPGFHRTPEIRKFFGMSAAPDESFKDINDVIRKRVKHIRPEDL